MKKTLEDCQQLMKAFPFLSPLLEEIARWDLLCTIDTAVERSHAFVYENCQAVQLPLRNMHRAQPHLDPGDSQFAEYDNDANGPLFQGTVRRFLIRILSALRLLRGAHGAEQRSKDNMFGVNVTDRLEIACDFAAMSPANDLNRYILVVRAYRTKATTRKHYIMCKEHWVELDSLIALNNFRPDEPWGYCSDEAMLPEVLRPFMVPIPTAPKLMYHFNRIDSTSYDRFVLPKLTLGEYDSPIDEDQ